MPYTQVLQPYNTPITHTATGEVGHAEHQEYIGKVREIIGIIEVSGTGQRLSYYGDTQLHKS